MRKLSISSYRSRYDKDKKLKVQEVSWEQLVKRLQDSKETGETFEEYEDMESLDRLAVKDVGWFVGGKFDPPLRKSFNLRARSVLTLDLDHIEPWEIDEISLTYRHFEYLIHSSHSHSEDSPRLRLVMPMTRDVTPEEYEPIARWVANMLDMDVFDDSTYQYSRIMFWPSHSKGSTPVFERNECGRWVDPDEILANYEDVGDFKEWPRSSREDRIRPSASKAADPYTKPGVIGAFNRAFTIPEAIERFDLPYTESGKGDDRYSYLQGTSADGAVYYPDDGHLYSHHDSDPAKGNHNAFDLVRLHLFGDDADDDTPMMKRETVRKMITHVANIPEVIKELADDEGFDDLGDDAESETDGEKLSEYTFDSIKLFLSEKDELSREDLDDFILKVAVADDSLDAVDSSMLVDAASKKAKGATKTAIKAAIKAKREQLRSKKGADEDIQLELLRRFTRERYADGRYIKRKGKQFWTYNGMHWEPADDETVSGEFLDFIGTLREDPAMKKKYKRLAKQLDEQTVTGVWRTLTAAFSARTARLTESDPMGLTDKALSPAINCLNGTIKYRGDGKATMNEHDPEDRFINVVNARYDKDAECPAWDKYCHDVFEKCKDPAGMRRHMEELMGYTLNRSRNLRAWVMIYGPSGSGKSTFTEVLEHMLGPAYLGNSMEAFSGSNNHAYAALVGKQMLVDDDYKAGRKLNDEFLKKVAEEKTQQANPKGKDEIPFVLRLVTYILTNNIPATSDTSGGLYSRALVFPFKHVVPYAKVDTQLKSKLFAEADGIFTRCARAYGRLVKRGQWDFPADASRAWQAWIDESNPLTLFVSECLQRERAGRLPADEVYEQYKRWVENEYADSTVAHKYTKAKTTFYRALDGILGAERGRLSSGKAYWPGWSLSQDLVDDELSTSAAFEKEEES